MTRLISSCWAERPRGSLATSISSTSRGQLAEQLARAPAGRRRRRRPPSAPCGRRPTSGRGRPGRRRRGRRRPGGRAGAGPTIVPSRSPSRISSRTAAERRGSRLPSTATVTPACRPTAGVQAVARVASSARTQKIRRSSAAALTRSLAAGSSVAAMTYQAPSRSAPRTRARTQVTSPRADQPLDRRGDLRRDDGHVGAGGQQRRHPALGDVAAADDHDASAGEPEAGGVRREVVHRPIIPAGRLRTVARVHPPD